MPGDNTPAQPVVDKPLDVDGVAAFGVGTAVWAVATIAVILFGDLDSETIWMLWTCLAGVGIGLLGLAYSTRRAAAYRAAGGSAADRGQE